MPNAVPRPSTVPPSNDPRHERLGRLLKAIADELRPLRRARLQGAVDYLSAALSQHRGSTVRHDYLADEYVQAAYCAHFLPWNVYRLMHAWDASRPAFLQEKPAVIEDWGAGPLTALLAMWVAGGNESLRGKVYRAREKQHEMLEWGARISARLGVWDAVNVVPRTGEIAFDEPSGPTGEADALIVANAFNEWLPPRGRSTEPIRAFVHCALRAVRKGGELFVMEPANRVVSWGVMELRNALIHAGVSILAPCTHHAACPLLDSRLRSWCHFRKAVTPHPAHAALPSPLGTGREDVAWSYLHARNGSRESPSEPNFALARVLGDPMKVELGRGVYACGPDGRMLLVTKAERWQPELARCLQQGAVVSYRRTEKSMRDRHSDARLEWVSECRTPDGRRLGDDGREKVVKPRKHPRAAPRLPERRNAQERKGSSNAWRRAPSKSVKRKP